MGGCCAWSKDVVVVVLVMWCCVVLREWVLWGTGKLLLYAFVVAWVYSCYWSLVVVIVSCCLNAWIVRQVRSVQTVQQRGQGSHDA